MIKGQYSKISSIVLYFYVYFLLALNYLTTIQYSFKVLFAIRNLCTYKEAIMKTDIKKFRSLINMSQRQFASYFSIPLGTLRNWEQGISKPPEYVLSMLISSIRRDKMINVETIKFIKMLDRLANLEKDGIFEFKKATQNDVKSSKVFYDEKSKDSDGNYRVVMDMCVIDDPECTHHDIISYYDSDTEEFTVRVVIDEDDKYIIVKFFNNEEQIVIENGSWYFV